MGERHEIEVTEELLRELDFDGMPVSAANVRALIREIRRLRQMLSVEATFAAEATRQANEYHAELAKMAALFEEVLDTIDSDTSPSRDIWTEANAMIAKWLPKEVSDG